MSMTVIMNVMMKILGALTPSGNGQMIDVEMNVRTSSVNVVNGYKGTIGTIEGLELQLADCGISHRTAVKAVRALSDTMQGLKHFDLNAKMELRRVAEATASKAEFIAGCECLDCAIEVVKDYPQYEEDLTGRTIAVGNQNGFKTIEPSTHELLTSDQVRDKIQDNQDMQSIVDSKSTSARKVAFTYNHTCYDGEGDEVMVSLAHAQKKLVSQIVSASHYSGYVPIAIFVGDDDDIRWAVETPEKAGELKKPHQNHNVDMEIDGEIQSVFTGLKEGEEGFDDSRFTEAETWDRTTLTGADIRRLIQLWNNNIAELNEEVDYRNELGLTKALYGEAKYFPFNTTGARQASSMIGKLLKQMKEDTIRQYDGLDRYGKGSVSVNVVMAEYREVQAFDDWCVTDFGEDYCHADAVIDQLTIDGESVLRSTGWSSRQNDTTFINTDSGRWKLSYCFQDDYESNERCPTVSCSMPAVDDIDSVRDLCDTLLEGFTTTGEHKSEYLLRVATEGKNVKLINAKAVATMTGKYQAIIGQAIPETDFTPFGASAEDTDAYEDMTWETPSDELADAVENLLAEVKRFGASAEDIDTDAYEDMTWETPSDELEDAVENLLAEVKRLRNGIMNAYGVGTQEEYQELIENSDSTSVRLEVPDDQWDVIMETLMLDIDSGAIEPAERKRIIQAINSIQYGNEAIEEDMAKVKELIPQLAGFDVFKRPLWQIDLADAAEMLELGITDCVWAANYSDDNYGTELEPHHSYPIECSETLCAMIEEDVDVVIVEEPMYYNKLGLLLDGHNTCRIDDKLKTNSMRLVTKEEGLRAEYKPAVISNISDAAIFYQSRDAFKLGFMGKDEAGEWGKLYPETIEDIQEKYVRLPDQVLEIMSDNHLFDEMSLEEVFRVMNHDSMNPMSAFHEAGGFQDWMGDNGVGHTSMSENDIIAIRVDDKWTYHVCDAIGWKEVRIVDVQDAKTTSSRTTQDSLVADWLAMASKQLVGRTIKEVQYMSSDETEDNYWTRRPLMLRLDNDAWVIPQSDSEGNDAGVLFIATLDDQIICPCMEVVR